MKIEFINHSSIIIDSNELRILCDPWYKGTAFANGWRLLYDEEIDINSLEFDYIWISHEHPDHFSIPTLRSLKASKTFLYQKTLDQKVKKWLEKNGHKVIEMAHNESMELGNLSLTTIITEGYDSCLLVDDGNKKFLNVNDSQLDRPNEVAKFISHTPIDYIAMQFHYANWAGNPGDQKIPEIKRSDAVNRIIKVANSLKPRNTLLFASYIYYCHEENFFWNEGHAFEKTFHAVDSMNINPIIPIPGDTINLSDEADLLISATKNEKSLNFWNSALSAIAPTETTKMVGIQELQSAYNNYFSTIHKANNTEKYIGTEIGGFHLNVCLTDHDQDVQLGLFKNNFELKQTTPDTVCDVSVSSEALLLMLTTDFGLGSITISSRINFNYEKAFKLYFFFLLPYRNNIGVYLEDDLLEDLNFAAFKDNGVLRPIFKINEKARVNFGNFYSLLEAVN